MNWLAFARTLMVATLATFGLPACSSNAPLAPDSVASPDAATDAVATDALATDAPLAPGVMKWVDDFGANPGGLRMSVFEPPQPASPAAVVVAMHGCMQSARDYANVGWNELATAQGFYVIYPEQVAANNQLRCFNWFSTEDTKRDMGEAASVRQMIAWAQAHYRVDAARIYVTGLSAGAGMTAVMLATYPEVFAAGALIAGVPYGCATSSLGAAMCMNPGRNYSPTTWKQEVAGASTHTGPWPRVSIWHGKGDTVVAASNADESMEQWTAVHEVDQTADGSETVGDLTRTVYQNASGQAVVETVFVRSMGHGTPVAPASGCGLAGPYVLDVGVCSSQQIARFFGLI